MGKNRVETVQNIVRVAVAAVAGFWHGLPHATQILLLLMAADVALGVGVAIRDKAYNLDTARAGAFRKFGVLAMVGIAGVLTPYVVDVVGVNLLQAASAFYAVPELASVTRNAATLGAPSFPQLELVLGYFDRQSVDKSRASVEGMKR